MEHLAQILALLAITIVVVVGFQRLHVPTSLGYLLVGIIVGPHTAGPTLSVPEFQPLAEFGLVFLLFTIGLNFSLPRIHALRHQVLGLGTGQVVFTTLTVGVVLWVAGLTAPAAFVFGAVFAQSSTTIIASLLRERGEEDSQHGRLGLAISVFQDVTAVPFLVIIPVIGTSVAVSTLAMSLGWALATGVAAFVLVFFAGRWLLRPLFHLVSQRRSPEVFTLAVLMVALLAAWTTHGFGLSLAFGGFLAGMMLGETEFRPQVESSIRPFRDVLLGMFFVGIGMRLDPAALPPIWHWAVLGACLIIVSKTLIVMPLVRRLGIDARVAWRTGLVLSIGGEFGLALTSIALDAGVIDMQLSQVAMASVLLSMLIGAALIHFNGPISAWLTRPEPSATSTAAALSAADEQTVIIAGYGRVGHTVAVLLHASNVPFVVLDTDPKQVAKGLATGFPVFYGDITDPGLLSALHVERAALVVITVDKTETALEALRALRAYCPQVPAIARARDLESSAKLIEAGALEAFPETIEASLRLGAMTLRTLRIPVEDVERLLQEVREWGYRPILEDTQDP